MSSPNWKGEKPLSINVNQSSYPVLPSAPPFSQTRSPVRNYESTVTFNLPETPPASRVDAIKGNKENPPTYDQISPSIHILGSPSSSRTNYPTLPPNYTGGIAYPFYPTRMIGAIKVMGTWSLICFFILFLIVTTTIAYGAYIMFKNMRDFDNRDKSLF